MKGSVGSPKWIAKQQKAKGSQRSKWYCQMCEKQCRDEHGFRSHSSSPSHRAKVEDLAHKIPEFSAKFEAEFLATSRSMPRQQVEANRVYAEIIKNRDHVHMNATKWRSLSAFIKHLGSTEKVRVIMMDPIVIEYIDREEQAKRQRLEEERTKKEQEQISVQRQVLEAQLSNTDESQIDNQNDKPNDGQESRLQHEKPTNIIQNAPIKFSLKRKK